MDNFSIAIGFGSLSPSPNPLRPLPEPGFRQAGVRQDYPLPDIPESTFSNLPNSNPND